MLFFWIEFSQPYGSVGTDIVLYNFNDAALLLAVHNIIDIHYEKRS